MLETAPRNDILIKMSTLYSTKAEKYAKYRWDYAPDAIAAIFDAVGISDQTVIADLGAGTGILTKHFVGQARLVYAIEPEAEMGAMLEKAVSGNQFCQIINRSAENTGLPAHSVDLITVGQAIHWFEPEAARSEFQRLLKPGGWLAVLRNYGTDPGYEGAVKTLFVKSMDIGIGQRGVSVNEVQEPIYINLYSISLAFGLLIKINFVSLLMIILVIIYFKWWYL